MDGVALLDTVRTETETELDRLGSEKSLLAATEARLEPDPVLVTAAATLRTAEETLGAWADTAADETAADALRTAADTLGDAFDRVTAELEGDGEDVAAIDAPFLVLDADGDIARLGAGTLGVALVLDRLFLQTVSFFVNEADSPRADLFRELRTDTDAILETGKTALDALCTGEDWDRAEAATIAVVEAAYADYAERLDAMGFDPKPIC